MPSAARSVALLAAISIGASMTLEAATRIHRDPWTIWSSLGLAHERKHPYRRARGNRH